ncbi:histidine kinase [Plantactinospora sp. B5E13]|uniref:sensor histidine kinase n=1 Tax=unclassified Plantactinospora TaxID=2631981 RepID=UPI00325D9E03
MTDRAVVMERWRTGLARLWRRTAVPPPRSSRWAWGADVLLAVALAVGILNGLVGDEVRAERQDMPGPLPGMPSTAPVVPPEWIIMPPRPEPISGSELALWILLALATALPVALRRRYPLAVFWVVLAASELYHGRGGLDATFTFAACVVVAYGAVMYSPYRAAAVVSVLVGAVLVVSGHRGNLPQTQPELVFLFLLVPVALAANAVHTLRQRVQAVEAQRETETRLAVQRERARIAQELHDVVTHNVSVMVVQAGAARTVLAVAPEKAHQALLAIESGGRAAMSELRHVMGLLSLDGDPDDQPGADELTPPPGLGQVPTLVARVRSAGVPVALTVTGTPEPLPVGVDLAAYRVLQEALTNVVKHAAGASVTVRIAHGPDVLRIEVSDTGGTAAVSARFGNGRGLIGLRERLAIYGGTLDVGPLRSGGYQVRATIPVGPS